MTKPPQYADLASLPEDQRIRLIGEKAAAGAVVAIVLDDDVQADRYLEKLQQRYRVQVINRGPGPVPNTVLMRVGPRAANPEHPVVQQLHDHWHKITAFMMMKLGLKTFEITAADIQRYAREFEGGGVAIKPRNDNVIEIQLVTREEAVQLVAVEDGTMHFGVGKKP